MPRIIGSKVSTKKNSANTVSQKIDVVFCDLIVQFDQRPLHLQLSLVLQVDWLNSVHILSSQIAQLIQAIKLEVFMKRKVPRIQSAAVALSRLIRPQCAQSLIIRPAALRKRNGRRLPQCRGQRIGVHFRHIERRAPPRSIQTPVRAVAVDAEQFEPGAPLSRRIVFVHSARSSSYPTGASGSSSVASSQPIRPNPPI